MPHNFLFVLQAVFLVFEKRGVSQSLSHKQCTNHSCARFLKLSSGVYVRGVRSVHNESKFMRAVGSDVVPITTGHIDVKSLV